MVTKLDLQELKTTIFNPYYPELKGLFTSDIPLVGEKDKLSS
jgi:hypothetical protein